jgi:glutaminyl-tRNA synthetase
VRLRYAYFVRCTGVVKDDAGQVVEVRCTYDPATRGGDAPDGRRVKVTMHWVAAARASAAVVRLYDRLFAQENPDEAEDFLSALNPDSLEVLQGCRIEPALAQVAPGDVVQFERLGYFAADAVESRPGNPVFNRAVTLRDAWEKLKSAGGGR